MPAKKSLDALVAKNVMGWRRDKEGPQKQFALRRFP
jgi:hypothetical protein